MIGSPQETFLLDQERQAATLDRVKAQHIDEIKGITVVGVRIGTTAPER